MWRRSTWWWVLGCVTIVALPAVAQTGDENDPIEVEIVEGEDEDTPPEIPPLTIEQPLPVSPRVPSSRWVAGAWCALRSSSADSGGEQQTADPPAEGPSGSDGGDGQQDDDRPPSTVDGVDEIGCDVGAGMRLIGRCYSQGCISLIGALGMRTVGFGIAWTVTDIGDRPVSVAIGYALPFNGDGIYHDAGSIVLGATVSVGGRGR